VTVVYFMSVERRIEVMGRRGRMLKKLPGDLQERRGYRKLKEEALDCTLWRTRFGRVYGPLLGRDSSVGIATQYGLGGPGIESRRGARFSAPVQTDPGAHPPSYTTGTGWFPGVKWPGRGVYHPPLSSAEVKERVELYLYSSFGPSWPVLGWTLTLPLPLPWPWPLLLNLS